MVGVRRSLVALMVGVTLILVVPMPARASGVQYADPADDARDVHNLELDARSSDPELDLLEVRWASTAEELVITTKLKAVGEPVASNGWALSHFFEYGAMEFELLGQEMGTPSERAFPDGVYLRGRYDSSVEYACVCRMTIDRAKTEVTVRIELNSIGSAVRTQDPRAKRPGPGSVIEVVSSRSFRAAGISPRRRSGLPHQGPQPHPLGPGSGGSKGRWASAMEWLFRD